MQATTASSPSSRPNTPNGPVLPPDLAASPPEQDEAPGRASGPGAPERPSVQDADHSTPGARTEGRRIRSNVAASLLSRDGDWSALGRRAAAGAVLSAAYGGALGAREGGLDLLTHMVGVPAALIAVALLGLPALYIVLALLNAPLSVERAAGAASRGIASAGLVLAGLAPLAALYVVTSSSHEAAATAGGLGLFIGGALGLRHLVSTLSEALAQAPSTTRFVAGVSQLGFSLFAVLLAWRVWGALLPLVGGAS